MEKSRTLHKYVGHTLHALMMTLLFLWCSVSVSAQGTGTKDAPYIWTDETEGIATADGAQFAATGYRLFAAFTPKTNGILVFSCSYSQFTDNTFAKQSPTQPEWNGTYPQQYKLNCTAGNTYYVGGSTSSSNVTVKYLAKEEELKLTKSSPESGSVFDVIRGTVNLAFNKKVSISGCVVTIGSKTVKSTVMVNNAYASVDVKTQVMQAYNDGSLTEGDDIKFAFSGIKDLDNKDLNGTGTFEVTYKAPAKPMTLVSSTHTPSGLDPVFDFKSYYMKDDANSVVTVTFSDLVGSVESVNLTYGNIDGTGEDDAPSQYYMEPIDYKLDGKSIIIDFKGKLRRVIDMIPGVDMETIPAAFKDRFTKMNLSISGVRDSKGNLAYSSGQGTLGSYGFVYEYKEVKYEPVSDWQVVEGSAITSDTKDVELWLKETGGNATFTGVKFAYKDNDEDKTAVVPFNEIIASVDPGDEAAKIFTIPVPDVNMDEGTVTVSLDGVEAPDGVDHEEYSKELTCSGRTAAAANELAVKSAKLHAASGDVEMVNGSIGTIVSKTTATITLNKEVGFMKWEVSEPELGVLKSSYGTPNSSSFDVTFRGADLKCLTGKTYTFTLKAWNNETESQGNAAPTIGTATFTFTGTETAYVYSDVVLQSHIEDPYPLMNSDETTYTLEFNNPATVKKAVVNAGNGESLTCKVEAVEGTNDMTWIVTLPAEALSESQILLNVFAEDKDHHAINKALDYTCPTDGGDNVWLPITLEAEFNKPAFTVEPASESVLDKIDVITFSYSAYDETIGGIAPSAINPSYNISDKIKIMTDGGRTPLYELGFDDVKRPDGYDGTDKLCIVLDNPITEAGNYIIDVPSGFFELGEEFNGASSRATTIYYEIKGSTGNEVKVTPESESVVESLEKITFTYESGINANWNNNDNITVQKRENTTTYTDVASFTADDVEYDFDDAANMWIDFAEPITEPGIYVVNIPAGFFTLGESGDDVNEAMVIYYEIKAKQPVGDGLALTANPAGGKVTEIPATIVISADCDEAGFEDYELMPTLVDANNVSYPLDVELDPIAYNAVDVVLKNGAITEDGVYTLTIPAGAITDDYGKGNDQFQIVYVIGTGTGIDNIVANAGGKVDVYTVNGVAVLRNADAAAVKSLTKGLYIINGKKVVIM